MVSINDLLPPPRDGQDKRAGLRRIQLTREAPQTLVSRRQALDLARPSAADREEQLDRTRAALDALIAARNGNAPAAPRVQTVEYAPAGERASHTLRIIEEQHDPLEPPRHRFKKEAPSVPATDSAAPILRREATLTAEEKRQWHVPASVSNWKNSRGFLIDLETRAAADKPTAHVSAERQSELAAALTSADSELKADAEAKRAEEREAASRIQDQQRLKMRLLAQKTSARGSTREPESDDLFDSRLYHKSKRRHETYDAPLFAAAQSSVPRQLRSGQDDTQGIKEVEFEEYKEH